MKPTHTLLEYGSPDPTPTEYSKPSPAFIELGNYEASLEPDNAKLPLIKSGNPDPSPLRKRRHRRTGAGHD